MRKFLNDDNPILLFLHIPKTAGRTLTKEILFDQYRTEEWYKAAEGWLCSGIYYYPAGLQKETAISDEAKQALARADVRCVVGHYSFGVHEHLRRPWTYVTVLRHPVDRVISLYEHIRKWDTTSWHQQVITNDVTLEDFIRQFAPLEMDNDQTRRISGVEPPFGSCTSSMLIQAKHNLLEYFSVVGAAEQFDATLLLMKKTLGWTSPLKYFPRGVNYERTRREALSDATLELIMTYNQLDLELWQFVSNVLKERLVVEGPNFEAELVQFKVQNNEYIFVETKSRQRLAP